MSKIVTVLIASAVLSGFASQALALNPQPLPPGIYARGGHTPEPPDPCVRLPHHFGGHPFGAGGQLVGKRIH